LDGCNTTIHKVDQLTDSDNLNDSRRSANVTLEIRR
jgi:hypothetical protein